MKKLLTLGILLGAAVAASAASYEVDPAHTSVEFKVRHVVGKVRGRFTKFSGTFEYDAKAPNDSKVTADVDAASVDTNTEARDNDLRSDHFFDVKNCPKLTFKSTKVSLKDGKGTLEGDLTIRCTTKHVTFQLEVLGAGKDPWGNESLAASATTTVNRKDFGLTWNKALETGGFLVGDDVEITLDVEGAKKAEAAPKASAPAKKKS